MFYYDLNDDEDLFEGGDADDSTDHHQVYRLMRECTKSVYTYYIPLFIFFFQYSIPVLDVYFRNDWRGFHPVTNVLWLEHLLGKLLFMERLVSPPPSLFLSLSFFLSLFLFLSLSLSLSLSLIMICVFRYDDMDEVTLDLLELLIEGTRSSGKCRSYTFSFESMINYGRINFVFILESATELVFSAQFQSVLSFLNYEWK